MKLRDKTMVDKLMYVPMNDKNNNPFCRLQFMVETFGHSTWSEVVKSTNKKEQYPPPPCKLVLLAA